MAYIGFLAQVYFSLCQSPYKSNKNKQMHKVLKYTSIRVPVLHTSVLWIYLFAWIMHEVLVIGGNVRFSLVVL